MKDFLLDLALCVLCILSIAPIMAAFAGLLQ